MKKIKEHEIGPWCKWCPEKTVRAVWRASGHIGEHACEEHREDLLTYERKVRNTEDHLSEADYQTWMRV